MTGSAGKKTRMNTLPAWGAYTWLTPAMVAGSSGPVTPLPSVGFDWIRGGEKAAEVMLDVYALGVVDSDTDRGDEACWDSDPASDPAPVLERPPLREVGSAPAVEE